MTAETPTTTVVVASSEPPAGDKGVVLKWTEADLSGETFLDQLIATDGGFVAYRFAHDPQAWVSDDGLTWIPRDLAGDLGDSLFLSSEITAGGQGFVALGSTFNEDNLLFTSEDGFNWESQELDLNIPGKDFEGFEKLIAGPNGYLLQGFRTTSFQDDHGDGHEHPIVLLHSENGLEWKLLPDGDELFGAGAQVQEILATNQGYIAHGYVDGENGGERFWLSPDGRSWEESATEFFNGRGFVAEPGPVRWGDKLLTVYGTDEATELWTSEDGRSWEQLPVDASLVTTDEFRVFAERVAAGPFGIVLLGVLEPPPIPMPPVVLEKGGLVLTFDLNTSFLTATDPTSRTVILEVPLDDEDHVRIDEATSTLTIVDPGSGEDLASFTFDEFEAAREKSWEEAGFDPSVFDEGQFKPVLWFSPDGRNWEMTPLEDISGFTEFPYEVVVGSDSLILRMPNFSDDAGDIGQESNAAVYGDEPEIIWVGRIGGG